MTDVLIISPSSRSLYQELQNDFSAIETPIWAGLLANSVRGINKDVIIYDANLERPSPEDLADVVENYNPRMILLVATGANPNASSSSMTGVVEAATIIKQQCLINYPIMVVGPHVNALPVETLEKHDCIDICLTNEGVYALRTLVAGGIDDLPSVNGIAYRDSVGDIRLNPAQHIVPQELLATHLPGVAYDLMPSLDRYRTSSWHANYIDEDRSPFASIYTSLGCPHKCSFCMINQINRTDNDPNHTAANFNVFRHWEPEYLINQFEYLANQGVKQIKIADELFVLRPRHFLGLCDLIIDRGFDFNIWAYSRIDTVRPQYLEKLKAAGVNWLALGIESANRTVRQEITKGKFQDMDIQEVVAMIEDAGINVMANIMMGIGNDTWDTMQETLDLAIELNTAAMNVYAATALPGSPLFLEHRQNGGCIPNDYSEYGFLSYQHIPNGTPNLSPSEVVAFRDYAWHAYHAHPRFLQRLKNDFGDSAVREVQKMSSVSLSRKILENWP